MLSFLLLKLENMIITKCFTTHAFLLLALLLFPILQRLPEFCCWVRPKFETCVALQGYALLCVGFPTSDIEVETQDEDEVINEPIGKCDLFVCFDLNKISPFKLIMFQTESRL